MGYSTVQKAILIGQSVTEDTCQVTSSSIVYLKENIGLTATWPLLVKPNPDQMLMFVLAKAVAVGRRSAVYANSVLQWNLDLTNLDLTNSSV